MLSSNLNYGKSDSTFCCKFIKKRVEQAQQLGLCGQCEFVLLRIHLLVISFIALL
jgi:hypothetical protein